MAVIDTCTATWVSPGYMCVCTYVDVGVDAVSVGVTVVCVMDLHALGGVRMHGSDSNYLNISSISWAVVYVCLHMHCSIHVHVCMYVCMYVHVG